MPRPSTEPAYPGGFGRPSYPPPRVDASAQGEKQAFLNQPGEVTGSLDDLRATLRDPSLPYLVMAATTISAVMIDGISRRLWLKGRQAGERDCRAPRNGTL